jgi:hypothetical protein
MRHEKTACVLACTRTYSKSSSEEADILFRTPILNAAGGAGV